MKAKEFLEQVEKIDKIIENKLLEVEQWKAIALGTTARTGGERVQASGSQQKMADAVAKYIDIENDINAHIDRLIEKKSEIIAVIEKLDVMEYDVLHKRYVQRLPLDEVATAFDKTYSWVTTVHGRALKSVQDILDERENNATA